MARNKKYTPTYSLSLRLETSEKENAILNQRFKVATHLYNICVKEARKRLNKLYKDAEYKKLIHNYKQTQKEKEALYVLQKKYNLAGMYSFEHYLNIGRQKFKSYIDSDTCAKISQMVWMSVAQNIFRHGKMIHFKEEFMMRSLYCKTNKSGIIYRDGYMKWLGLKIPVRVRKRDAYAKQCLKNDRIKYCRLKRRWHKHQWRYYLEIVFEGIPPLKKRKIGKGRVGIDIGTSTVAAVSEADIVFKELNDGIQSIDKEIEKLNRKADRLRRINNPQNYNPDGTIRRNSKAFHREWYVSKGLKNTYDKIRTLYQKRSDRLKQFQNELANEVVSMGDEIIVETMNFQGLQKKSKRTEKSEKTGRYKRKKRFGKSIQIHAPSQLIEKVKQRLAYQSGSLIEVNTYKMKASQYNHITGEYMPSDLNKRWKTLAPGIFIQRDIYSAYLLFNAVDTESVDTELCLQTFDNFKDSHDRLIENLRKEKQEGKTFPSCMGI